MTWKDPDLIAKKVSEWRFERQAWMDMFVFARGKLEDLDRRIEAWESERGTSR